MKLSVEKVVLGAVLIPWWNRDRFLSALLVPGLLIAVLQIAWVSYPDDPPQWMTWTAAGVNFLLYVVFAIACHRLVLVEGLQLPRVPGWSMRETRFTFFAAGIWIVAGLIAMGLAALTGSLVINAFDKVIVEDHLGTIMRAFTWMAIVVGAYVLGRLSLVLPATAVDTRLTLAQSWVATRGNGWRLALVVGALPWVLGKLTDLIYREGAGIVESAVVATLCVVTLTIEIAALSVAYKQLR